MSALDPKQTWQFDFAIRLRRSRIYHDVRRSQTKTNYADCGLRDVSGDDFRVDPLFSSADKTMDLDRIHILSFDRQHSRDPVT